MEGAWGGGKVGRLRVLVGRSHVGLAGVPWHAAGPPMITSPTIGIAHCGSRCDAAESMLRLDEYSMPDCQAVSGRVTVRPGYIVMHSVTHSFPSAPFLFWRTLPRFQGEDGHPLYSQFDDNGVPTHNAKGEEVNKVSRTVNLEFWNSLEF